MITKFGGYQRIKWLGHRRVNIAAHPAPELVRPVSILKGALGGGLPRHNLIVSPDHALYLDGLLVPAKILLNGGNIYQLDVPRAEYYHIELDAHDALFAEGVAAESYLCTGNRDRFDNGDGPVKLHPDFGQTMRESQSFAPLAETGLQVEAIRQRILDHAGIETSWEPALHIDYEDGQAIINSRSAIPGEIYAAPDDKRLLGVKIASLHIAGQQIPINHPALVQGWHEAEPDGRWTNGRATVPACLLQGAHSLEITLAAVMSYPCERLQAQAS